MQKTTIGMARLLINASSGFSTTRHFVNTLDCSLNATAVTRDKIYNEWKRSHFGSMSWLRDENGKNLLQRAIVKNNLELVNFLVEEREVKADYAEYKRSIITVTAADLAIAKSQLNVNPAIVHALEDKMCPGELSTMSYSQSRE